MINKTLVLLTGLLLAAGSAQASVINFSGAVTSVNGTQTGVAVGDAFIGKLILADSVDLSPGSLFGNGDGAYPNDITKTLRLTVNGTDYVNDTTSYDGTVSQNGNGLSQFGATSSGSFGTACAFLCTAEFNVDPVTGTSTFNIAQYGRDTLSGTFTAMIDQGASGGANDVPAPSSWLLFALALVGIVAVKRRRPFKSSTREFVA